MTRIRIIVLAGLSAAALASVPAGAAPVTVGCGLGPGYDYPSLTAAVTAIAGTPGPHLIVVEGICDEKVVLDQLSNVTIDGTHGATLTSPGATGPGALIRIVRSVAISVHNVRFENASRPAVEVVDSVGVTLSRLSMSQLPRGVDVLGQSTATIEACDIDHVQRGIFVGAGATATLRGSVPSTAVPLSIHDGDTGLVIDGGAVELRDEVVFESLTRGLVAIGGHLSGGGGGARVFRGNHVGLVVDGGHVELGNDTRVEGSRFAGILQEGGHVVLHGVAVTASTNDQSGQPGFAPAGITTHGGYLVLDRVSVTGNAQFGVMLSDGATGKILGSAITGNGRSGVRTQAGASLLIVGSTVSGNGGFDVVCTPDSSGHGLALGIATMFCPGFVEGADGVSGPDPQRGPRRHE